MFLPLPCLHSVLCRINEQSERVAAVLTALGAPLQFCSA